MQARAIILKNGEVHTSGVMGPVPWWSFTKTALAIAVMRLSDIGIIDLDKTIEGKAFTPAQLLRHEAGLPDYGSLAAYHADVEAGHPPWPAEVLIRVTDADRLRYEPGGGWAYSNIGYWHIARLIEQASGRPLATALVDLVFAPAELSTGRLAETPADLADVTMGDVTGYHPGWVYHGLVVGVALDAARLLRKLLEGKLLKDVTLSRMLEGRSLPQFRTHRYPDPAYGLGLMLRATDPRNHPIGHSGGGPGSEIAVYGRQGTTCAIWAATSAAIDPVSEASTVLETVRKS